MTTSPSLPFIDLFTGAGGLSCGLELAGHTCLLGVEKDPHAVNTFKFNHSQAETFCDDIKKLDKDEIKRLLHGEKVQLIVGGPPCQGFSTIGLGNPKDDRNNLFKEFIRIVDLMKPKFILMENVTGLIAKKNIKILHSIIKTFQSIGYTLSMEVIKCEYFGVPQHRRRTIIFGTRSLSPLPFPAITHDNPLSLPHGRGLKPFSTVGEALVDLKARDGKTYNHDLNKAQITKNIHLERIKCIPEGKSIRYEQDEKNYLPPHLYLGVNWSEKKENRLRQAKYQRLHRELQSPTITTHKLSYYHPTLHRYLTQREAARIQTFPNHFIFSGPITSQWEQIGNAVPPLIAKVLGEHFLKIAAHQSKSLKKNNSFAINTPTTSLDTLRGKAFKYSEDQTI